MRLGRLILASFTALAAYSYAQAAPRPVSAHESLRIFQAVVPLFTSVADAVPSTPAAHPAPHAVFTLEALTATPLAGAICLIASLAAVNLLLRRHQRSLLRC